MFKRIKGRDSVNGNMKGVPERPREDRIWSDRGGRALGLRLEQISHQYSWHKAM